MTDRISILVAGIGNPYRCDDGTGPEIAKTLAKMLPEQVEIRSDISDGLSLIYLWQEYDCVYLIDAVCPNGTPGKTYRFDVLSQPLPQNFFTGYSTHSINILETISLARNLDMLPEKLIIYGVEGKDFSIGTDLSGQVRHAVFRVACEIKKELDDHYKHLFKTT